VKTLQDRPRLFQTEESTVRALSVFPRPSSLPSTRLAQEQHVYVVTADVIAIQSETDGDLHVILSAGGRTMISEAPNSACTTQARPFRRLQMQQARESVRICQARVAGVLFFDFALGQYGHSPNYAELHPLLVFHCLYPLASVRRRTDSPLEQLLPSLPRPWRRSRRGRWSAESPLSARKIQRRAQELRQRGISIDRKPGGLLGGLNGHQRESSRPALLLADPSKGDNARSPDTRPHRPRRRNFRRRGHHRL